MLDELTAKLPLPVMLPAVGAWPISSAFAGVAKPREATTVRVRATTTRGTVRCTVRSYCWRPARDGGGRRTGLFGSADSLIGTCHYAHRRNHRPAPCFGLLHGEKWPGDGEAQIVTGDGEQGEQHQR